MAVEEQIKVSIIGDSGNLDKSVNRASQSLAKFERSSGSAAMALTNLGRVAQDAPFGFIGIQNNLNPLLESFGRLRAESGSNMKALKALSGSLMGAGGLGLALSAVSAAVLFAQKGTDSWTKGFQAADDKIKHHADTLREAKQAVQDYISTLNDSARIKIAGGQSADTDLIKLKVLYDASQNVNLALSERKKAVDALQDQYPAYFKNIADEAILVGAAKGEYDKLTTSIIASATAKAAEKELDTLAQELRVIKYQREEAQKNSDAALKAAQEREVQNNREIATAKKMGESTVALQNGINLAYNKYNDLRAVTAGLIQKENTLLKRQGAIAQEIQDSIVKNGFKIITDPTGKIEAPKEQSKKFEFFDRWFDANPATAQDKAMQAAEMYRTALDFAIKNQGTFGGLDKIIGATNQEETLKQATIWWENMKKGIISLKLSSPIDFSMIPAEQGKKDGMDYRKNFVEGFKQGDEAQMAGEGSDLFNVPKDPSNDKLKAFEGFRDEMKDLGFTLPRIDLSKYIDTKDLQRHLDYMKDFNLKMRALFVDLGTGVAVSMGEALGGGSLDGIFKSLGQTVGELLSGMGKYLIKASLEMMAFNKAIQALQFAPGVGLALGIGLVAAGTAFKGGVRPFASGGIVSGPTLGLMGEYAGAKSNPEVIAPLNKLRDLLGDMGGNTYNFDLKLRNRDLRLQRARSDRNKRRAG